MNMNNFLYNLKESRIFQFIVVLIIILNALTIGIKALQMSQTTMSGNSYYEPIKEIIEKNTNLGKDNIWVYLLDLKPSQMIEYGEILPKSGGEKKWFKNL